MTAISALQIVHKKGIFGDHHKKKESDLVKISELKNLSIIQIVKYKKSKMQTNNIEIDNLKVPVENSMVSSNEETRILWSAPENWLVISKKENLIKDIEEKCRVQDFAITDISHSRALIRVKGLQAREILKKGCPLNFNEFKKNNCASSVFNGISFVVDLVENNPDAFNLLTLRSFGESFYHHITDAALEFGYVGI